MAIMMIYKSILSKKIWRSLDSRLKAYNEQSNFFKFWRIEDVLIETDARPNR